jgi:predicted nucleotidyltransferase
MVRSGAWGHEVSLAPGSILGELFTSVTRARLLTLFLTHPTEEYYLRELARRSGQSLRAVQHELPRLERLELVLVRRRGRQKYYRANEQHPLFPELKRIVYKTAGLGDALKDAIAGIEGIDAAFIYGSVAKGGERSASDIDLMVVGDLDSEELHRAIRKAEKTLGREVSLVTMGPDEWRSRLASRDAFVEDLLKTDKIFLTGDERALRRA